MRKCEDKSETIAQPLYKNMKPILKILCAIPREMQRY